MMFDMIRNYFRVESDDFGRFWVLKSERTIADALPTRPPPLGRGGVMPTILRSGPQGGGCMYPFFFKTFLQKLTVLSDKEVPGCHKNIYRDLRPSFTRSEIFGNLCCLFRQQRQHSKISLWTGAPREALWKTVGKVIFHFSI